MLTNEEIAKMSDKDFYNELSKEFADLPRAQRRAKERELQHQIKLMKSFNPAQLRLIDDVTKDRAVRECEEQISRYLTVMDTCLSAYMYIKDEEMTTSEVKHELQIIDDMVVEYKSKLNNLINENRGNEKMAGKQLEKISETVREKCVELIENEMNQSKALVVLETQFPTLSKAMLVNAYKKVKASMKTKDEESKTLKQIHEEEKKKEGTAINAAVDYIFGEEDHKEEPKEEAPVLVEIKEEEIKVEKVSKLKIKSKEIVVEGEFGEYKIDRAGVEIGELMFGNISDVEQYAAEELDLFNRRISELKEVMVGEF